MNENLAIAVVGNFKFLLKHFNKFFKNITLEGNYSGDILVITTYFAPTFLLFKITASPNVQVLRFKKIKLLLRAFCSVFRSTLCSSCNTSGV